MTAGPSFAKVEVDVTPCHVASLHPRRANAAVTYRQYVTGYGHTTVTGPDYPERLVRRRDVRGRFERGWIASGFCILHGVARGLPEILAVPSSHSTFTYYAYASSQLRQGDGYGQKDIR